MSLIADALKAAQQERLEQSGRSDAAARRRFASSALRSSATLSIPRRGGLSSFSPSVWISVGVFAMALALGGGLLAAGSGAPVPRFAREAGVTGPASALVDDEAALPLRMAPTPEAPGPQQGIVGADAPAGGSALEQMVSRARTAAAAVDERRAAVADEVAYVTGSAEAPASEPFIEEVVAAPEPTARVSVSAAPSVAPPTSPDARLEVTVRAADQPSNALFNEAVAAQRRGDLRGAVDLYRQVLAGGPANPAEVHNNFGTALQALGDLPAARASFERALAIQPAYAAAWSNLGVLLGAMGDESGAVAALAEATRLDPANLGARVNLALMYQRRGMPEDAQRILTAVLATDARHPEAHYALARLLDGRGDRTGALEHYRTFLTVASARFPQYDAAVRLRIQQLEAAGAR